MNKKTTETNYSLRSKRNPPLTRLIPLPLILFAFSLFAESNFRHQSLVGSTRKDPDYFGI